MRIDIGLDLDQVGRQEAAENDASQPKHTKGAKNRDRRTQQHAKRQRPAFIKCGENQENEQQRKPEDCGRRNTFAGFLFLKRNARVVETHLARHGLLENRFERIGCLFGAIAGRGAAVDLGGTKFVEAQSKFGTKARLDCSQGRKRDVLSLVVADIELPHVVGAGAVFAFRFDVDLKLASEAIEIIDEISAHERLDGAVDITEADSLLQYFVAVHIDKLLRNTRQESRTEAGDFRPLSSGFEKCGQIFSEKRNIATGTVFKNESEASGCADARNGRRRKTEGDSLGQLTQLAIKMRLNGLKLLGSRGAIVPRIEGDDEKCVVTGTNETQQAEAHGCGRVMNPRRIQNNFFDLCRHCGGPFERRSVWQLKIDVSVALVFVRQETRRHESREKSCGDAEGHEQHNDDHCFSEQHAAPANVTIGRLLETAVKPVEESLQQSVTWFLGTQQQRSQSGAECKSVEC